jgi:hypothetical protein
MVASLSSGLFDLLSEEEQPATASNMTSSTVISLDFISASLLNEIVMIVKRL